MELLQLTYFCDAAETENFSRTAETYRVPPSDVSQCIKRLEEELGVKLFDRSANRIALNQQGRLFSRKAKQALLLLKEAKEEVADREDTGVLRLSVQTNRRIVMQAVQAFRQRYPMVDVITNHDVHGNPDEYHLIIGSDGAEKAGFKSQKLLSETIYVAMPKDDPLTTSETFTFDKLRGAAFISMSPGNSMHRILVDVSRQWGFEPRIAIQSDDPFYIRKCVELGLGVAVIPSVSWKGQFSEGIFLKKIEGVQRNTYLYWNDKKYIPACAKAFLKMLIETVEADAESGI